MIVGGFDHGTVSILNFILTTDIIIIIIVKRHKKQTPLKVGGKWEEDIFKK